MELHPTDERDFARIDQAQYFIASIFLGRGKFDKVERSSLEAARKLAEEMAAYYQNGRRGMVYAVLPDGSSLFVPKHYNPRRTKMSGYSKKSNAQRAAKSRGLDPNAVHQAADGKWYLDSIPEEGAELFVQEEETVMETERVVTDENEEVAPASPAEGETVEDTTEAEAVEEATEEAEKPKRRRRGEGAAPRIGKRAAVEAAALNGELPEPPDFSAPSHKSWRKKLEQLVELVEAGNIEDLELFHIPTYSSSPQAMNRYRNLAVTALRARQSQTDSE